VRAGDKIGFIIKVDHMPEHVTGEIVSMETGANGHLQHGWVYVDKYDRYVGITPDTVIDPPVTEAKP